MGSPEDFDAGVLAKLEGKVGTQTLREIVGLFLDHAPGRLAAVRDGWRESELTASVIALHSLKSSAAMLGARELSGLAESMERMAREDDREALGSLIGELDRAYSRAETRLREYGRRDNG